jgi:hypothetical protein
VIEPRTKQAAFWEKEFSLSEMDVEQLYNHLLEVEQPQTIEQLLRVIIRYRIAAEVSDVKRRLAGRKIYQPEKAYEIGDDLVFPVMGFAQGSVTGLREGYNPEAGKFNVIQVEIDQETYEFASSLSQEHALNGEAGNPIDLVADVNDEDIIEQYGVPLTETVRQTLEDREEFIRLGAEWFLNSLLTDVSIGHLHLAEAVLEMSGGGPLPVEEILPHLDMDQRAAKKTLAFSLNYALSNDTRFDEVAPKNKVAWYLNRMEPEEVKKTPDRLQYTPIPHDRALLSPQLLQLERELDDEWSGFDAPQSAFPAVFTLLFPHRYSGTIPLSSRIRPLLPLGRSPRQRIEFIDEHSQERIVGWVVKDGRYIYGLADWYESNGIPIGGFVHLKPGPEPDTLILGFDKRRAQREWVRLATAVDNRIQFDLRKRAVACGFDDLLIVGTDVIAAIDALWRRSATHQRTVSSLLAELFVPLASLSPQNTVHAKTLYSAINMLRRVPPGPLFAELVKHPAFVPVGDHYWQFDNVRWRESNS